MSGSGSPVDVDNLFKSFLFFDSLSLSLYILYILCVPFDLTFSPLLLLLRDVNDDLKKFL